MAVDPKTWPDRDPQEVLDYGFNWTPRNIGDDVIISIVSTVITGTAVVMQDSITAADGEVKGAKAGQGTVHWLVGGTPGERSEIHLHATTAASRQLEQTIFQNVREN